MLLKGPLELSPRDHCQIWPVMPPSGSVRVAVSDTPSCGWDADRDTLPGSSTLVTLMVTVTVPVSPSSLVAVSVTV